MENDGILIIDKPVGLTSRAIDNRIGHLFSSRHVGHLGTLDPFASGMLIIGVNKGNKALTYIDDSKKTYRATLVLGKKTDSGDLTGIIIEEKEVPFLDKAKIEDTLSSFMGESTQIPPMRSAIKINGEALYKKAIRGEDIERKPRDITVYSIKLLDYEDNRITFETEVSRGTYIRTLGEDIASKLGSVGYLESLRRLSINDIKEEEMVKLDDIDVSSLRNPLPYISLKKVEIDKATYQKVLNGVRLSFPLKDERILLVYEDKPISVYIKTEEEGVYKAERGLF